MSQRVGFSFPFLFFFLLSQDVNKIYTLIYRFPFLNIVGEEKLFLLSLKFSARGERITLIKDRLTGGRKNAFVYRCHLHVHRKTR